MPQSGIVITTTFSACAIVVTTIQISPSTPPDHTGHEEDGIMQTLTKMEAKLASMHAVEVAISDHAASFPLGVGSSSRSQRSINRSIEASVTRAKAYTELLARVDAARKAVAGLDKARKVVAAANIALDTGTFKGVRMTAAQKRHMREIRADYSARIKRAERLLAA